MDPSAGTTGKLVRAPFVGNVDWSNKRMWSLGDSITNGVGGGPSEVGGCGWRDVLDNSLRAGGHVPMWRGSLTGGQGVAQCFLNSLPMAADGHNGYLCTNIQAQMAGWYAAGGVQPIDAVFFCGGTNDLIADQANSTSLAASQFDSCLAALVAMLPAGVRYFVSNLPPMGIGTIVPAFSAHVNSAVATYAAGGTRMYLLDDQSALLPAPSADFTSGLVHPNQAGYVKMAAVRYAAMIACPAA